MKLENEFLCLEVTEKGAEMMRLYNKETATEMLWNGDKRFWGYRAPILFPNVGNTYRKEMLIEGTIYETQQHGFARDKVFACQEETEERISFSLCSDAETKQSYPYDFELHITYELNRKTITVLWEVRNLSNKTMYFTIGGHPGFMFEKPEERKEDYFLYFPRVEKLIGTCVDLAYGTGYSDKKYELTLEDEALNLSDDLFDVDTLVFDDYQVNEVWLYKKEGRKPYVGIKCDDFYSIGIWSMKKAPFVCLEPWAGRCDDTGFKKDISEKVGINRVLPGDIFQKEYQIVIG